MRTVTLLVIHCSATPQGVGLSFEDCLPADTRTPAQKASLLALLRELKRHFPRALIVGHHDLDPRKACPCFDAVREYECQG